VYGTWFGITFVGLLALVALIALMVGGSPLFAVLFVLFALAFVATMVVFRRGQRRRAESGDGGAASGSSTATAAGGSAGAGGRAPNPRSGGRPVSGEGHAGGGETAGQRSSARR
jgi:hypothetical protein